MVITDIAYLYDCKYTCTWKCTGTQMYTYTYIYVRMYGKHCLFTDCQVHLMCIVDYYLILDRMRQAKSVVERVGRKFVLERKQSLFVRARRYRFLLSWWSLPLSASLPAGRSPGCPALAVSAAATLGKTFLCTSIPTREKFSKIVLNITSFRWNRTRALVGAMQAQNTASLQSQQAQSLRSSI